MEFKMPKPTNDIRLNENGVEEHLRVTDDGEVLYNDQPLETLEDHKKAIAMIVKGICSMLR